MGWGMLTCAGTHVVKLMLRWGWGWGGTKTTCHDDKTKQHPISRLPCRLYFLKCSTGTQLALSSFLRLDISRFGF